MTNVLCIIILNLLSFSFSFYTLKVVKKTMDMDGRHTPFKDNLPGDKWFSAFMRRNPRLAFRTPQPMGKERAVVTPARVDRWFTELETYLEELGATSILYEGNRMFNCDESGFALGGTRCNKVLAEKGSKVVPEFRNTDKTQITVLATVSAAGDFLPPMFIVPGKSTEAVGYYTANSPKNSLFAATESGWIDTVSFYLFVANLFHKQVEERKIPRPVLLLVDGHSTHQSMEVSTFCKNHGIILYRLPAHATHLLQPCDVSLFRALKAEWYLAERAYRIDHPGSFVTKTMFAGVFRHAWQKIITKPSIAINGFKAAGLFPFTKKYRTAHLLPSTLFKWSTPSPSSTSLCHSTMTAELGDLPPSVGQSSSIGAQGNLHYYDLFNYFLNVHIIDIII